MYDHIIVGFVVANDNAFVKPDQLLPFESIEEAEEFWKNRIKQNREKFVVEEWEGLDILNSHVYNP